MNFLEKCYDWLFAWTGGLQTILLLVIRVVWGVQFFFSGWAKLNSLEETAVYFKSIGIAEPDIMALTVALIESIGGAFLILGLLSRLDAFLLTSVMMGAYVMGHPEDLRSYQAFIASSPFLFLYASLIILAFGPGPLSLDALIRRSPPSKKA